MRKNIIVSLVVSILVSYGLVSCSNDNTSPAIKTDENIITFQNWNGDILDRYYQEEGSVPVFHGNQPTKKSDAEFDYEFDGWSPELGPVSSDMTYTAQFTQKDRQYDITFVNDDGTILSQENCKYLETPMFKNGTPVSSKKENGVQYTFAGWEPKIEPVTKNTTYHAIYDESTILYHATFLNFDGSLLQQIDTLEYGDIPEYTGDIPLRPSTESQYFEFSGWSPKIERITCDTIYQAQYTAVERKYDITWKNYDGAILKTEKYNFGGLPEFGDEEPIHPSDERYEYEFDGWYPEIGPVSGDMTYTAKFNRKDRKYDIVWKNYDGTVLKSEKYNYGSLPKFDYGYPTHPSDEIYNYEFDGWYPEITSVKENCVYTAVFTKRKKELRKIEFISEGVTVKTFKLEKGQIFDLKTVDKPSKKNFYGWLYKNYNELYTPDKLSHSWIVEDDMTFYAQFLIECASCKGLGKITSKCNYCYNGYVELRNTCSRCNGTGTIQTTAYGTCSKCNGVGIVSWKARCDCGFNTIIYQPDPWNNGVKNCPRCDFSTYLWTITPNKSCTKCGGSGMVAVIQNSTCPKCNGNKKIVTKETCSHCGGSGSIKSTCSNCKGNGRFISYMSDRVVL